MPMTTTCPDDGEAPKTLILIHGWCCHQGFWREQAEAFRHDFHIVTLDLPGHGNSRQKQSIWSMAELARDVVALAEARGPVGLVGHSMGGPVAVEAAILLGERCRFVLGVDTFTDAAFYRRRPADAIARRVKKFEAAFGETIAKMVHAITAPKTDPAVVDWIIGEMGRADPAVALPVLAALLDWDIEDRWPLLACPVETVNSAFLDRGIDRIGTLSGLHLHLMEDAGHFAMLERPAAFNGLALDIARRLWP